MRVFASDLCALTPAGADPRFALVVYLRHVAELEAQDHECVVSGGEIRGQHRGQHHTSIRDLAGMTDPLNHAVSA